MKNMDFPMMSLLLSLLLLLKLTSALYFHIEEGETKCFFEDVPDDTTFLVNYKVERYNNKTASSVPSSWGIGMLIEVREPTNQILLSRVYSAEGYLSLTTRMPGSHKICMRSNSTAWLHRSQLRVHLDIEDGAQAEDYTYLAERDKLTSEEVRVLQLVSQAQQILKEYQYYRYREQDFRQISKRTHQYVYWVALLQTVIFFLIVGCQMNQGRSSGDTNLLCRIHRLCCAPKKEPTVWTIQLDTPSKPWNFQVNTPRRTPFDFGKLRT